MTYNIFATIEILFAILMIQSIMARLYNRLVFHLSTYKAVVEPTESTSSKTKIETLHDFEEFNNDTPVDYSRLKTLELRKLCSSKQIFWRNAKGKNKHLNKAEMVAALLAVA